MSEVYRLLFRLPLSEKLDGVCSATLFTPYDKKHVWGQVYLSQNFMCFNSKVCTCIYLFKLKFFILFNVICILQSMCPLNVVIPLRDVSQIEKLDRISTDSSFNNAIILTLKFTSSNDKPPVFIFSQIFERSFFLKKVSELLGNLET